MNHQRPSDERKINRLNNVVQVLATTSSVANFDKTQWQEMAQKLATVLCEYPIAISNRDFEKFNDLQARAADLIAKVNAANKK